MNQRNLFSAGSLVLLALLFVGLVILSEMLFKGWRLDFTDNRQYTLSEGTQNILDAMEEPVTLYYFFTQEASRELPQIRNYARWVDEMLDEMAERSEGQLLVRRIDPKPFSPQEDEASQFGLQAIPVGASGNSLIFGIAGVNSLDDVQTMPFLQPVKEQFLEYDLAKMISSLSHPEPVKVGLLSSLEIEPGFDMQTRQPRPAWVIYEQLSQLFDLATIQNDAAGLPDDIELLIIVHPRDMTESMRYAVDQFVLGGGRVVAFIDPMAEADTGGDPADPMSRLNAGSSSTLGPLLEAWGIQFDPELVVGDQLYALQVTTAVGGPLQRHLGILSIPRAGLNQDDIISADLESVNMASAGFLRVLEGATTEFQPLATSSENAGPLDASRLRFLANPADLAGGFQPSGDRYVMAARISGPAESAFAAAPDGMPAVGHLQSAAPGGINVVLFADTDMLTDRMWVQRQEFFGQDMSSAFADNGSMVVNAVDNLLGSNDLISIRTRASSSRPFDRVETLRLKAESQFRETEERLNVELEETERQLVELQSVRTEGDLTVLNEDQQAALQQFTDRKIEIRKGLREVQLNLNREIDSLATRLKVINIVIVPGFVILVALVLAQRRRVKRNKAHK